MIIESLKNRVLGIKSKKKVELIAEPVK
jgi:hypothetical protein